MIRGVLSALPRRVASGLLSTSYQYRNELPKCSVKLFTNQQSSNFSSLIPGALNAVQPVSQFITKYARTTLLEPKQVSSEQIRTVIKFSLKKGKRKTVKTVLRRFFRLHWGMWIRRIAGRQRLWAKNRRRQNRQINHVMCNATQCRLLDKMVNRFWRKPKYYINDPYEVYHRREIFPMTRTKPWRPEGVDYE